MMLTIARAVMVLAAVLGVVMLVLFGIAAWAADGRFLLVGIVVGVAAVIAVFVGAGLFSQLDRRAVATVEILRDIRDGEGRS